MKHLKYYLLAVTISITGCASKPPKQLRGEFSNITPNSAKNNQELNHTVRWSGYIAHTVNNEELTCFEIIETETYKNLRPKKIIPKDTSRFLACKKGFLEPTAFNKRFVTITGDLVAYTKQKIDNYLYEYPVIETDDIYIWRNNPHYNYIDSRFLTSGPNYGAIRWYYK